jgi:hypothetical protein
MSQLWERQENDTPRSFSAFQIYLKLPSGERSLHRVAAALGHSADTQVEKWSSRHRWRERVDAYEDYVANSALAVRVVGLTEYQKSVSEQLTMGLAASYEIVMTLLGTVRDKIANNEPVDTRDVTRLISSLNEIDTMHRRNAGMPTVYKNETVSEPDRSDEEFIIGG